MSDNKQLYTLELEEAELELLLSMCRQSFRRTKDLNRRKMLGPMCDYIDATLTADMLMKAQRNIDALMASMEEHRKAEKRKHLRIV